jgi:hypothetical protein
MEKVVQNIKYSGMQSCNIFRAWEGFLSEFTNLSGVWKPENNLMGRAHMSAAHFRLTAQDGRPVSHASPVPGGRTHRVKSAQRRWPPVVAISRGLAPPYHCSGRHRGSRNPLHFFPSLARPCSSLPCSTLATASLPLSITDELP